MTERARPRATLSFSGLVDAGLMLFALGLLSPWLSRWLALGPWPRLAWLVDLASHWQWLFCVGLAVSVFIRLMQGATRWLRLCVALVVLPFLSASPSMLPAAKDGSEPHLRVAAINLLVTNTDASGLRAFLDRVQPDVVILTELHPDIAQVASTWADYPERHLLAEDSPFGIGVLSRVPWQDAEGQLDANGLPEIDVRLVWQDRPVLITALHPMPPINATWHQARNEKLQAAAKRQASFPGARLLVGDLNASPWSSALAPLREAYQRANSLDPTWPSHWLGKVGIPIDLILGSPDWSVRQFQVEPAFGSDHHPVWADLVLLPQAYAEKTEP